MSFRADGPVGQRIKPVLKHELSTRYNLHEEADDAAEYLLVLIADNKVPAEIVAEIKDVIDAPIDEPFINMLFGEIKNVTEQMNQEQQQQQQQQQVPPQPAAAPQPFAHFAAAQIPDDFEMEQDKVDFSNLPNRPGQFKGGKKMGGIGKQRNGKKPLGMNSANLERALNMGGENTKFVSRAPKGRCKDFPNCHNRDCKFAHPTKTCNAWPGCKNPPGTCNFIHPDEDQELLAKLEVSKKEYLEKRKNRTRVPEVVVTGIALCKYGALCSKELCPFGHPTPANIEAKVIDIVWCEDGKNCKNTSCRKAHPSPGYLSASVESAPNQGAPRNQGGYGAGPGPRQGPQKILEQCKYGLGCTNFNCPRRHATSSVPCRQGASCQRIDCTFAHPIDEDCRFGTNCTNKNCLYKHPEGRGIDNQSDDKTDQRMFAVPEDQVMEKAEQQPSLV